MLRAEIFTHTNEAYEKARTLFKEATAASHDDPEGAVRLFRNAREHAALSGIDFGVDVFLRLPRYLQAAGSSGEARREFENLLVHSYPNMHLASWSRRRMECEVYDKMRLFLQREKRFFEAVIFGAKSVIWDIKASLLYLEEVGPEWDYEIRRDREHLCRELTKLLRRARSLELLDETLDVLSEWADAQPGADDHAYETRLRTCLAELITGAEK